MKLQYWRNDTDKGKQSDRTKSSSSSNFSTTNTTWTGLSSNPVSLWKAGDYTKFNLLKPNSHVMHQQINIQQLYVLPTLYLCVLYLSENKQRLVPLTA